MKFKITDKNGNTYIAKKNAKNIKDSEETLLEETAVEETPVEETKDEVKLDETEILALKDLISKIPDLLKLLDNDNIDEEAEEKEEESSEVDLDEEVVDFADDNEEEAEDDLVTEEEVETNDCGNNISDSKQSFGSIETRRSTVEVDDNEIAQVWARRYGGK